VELEHGLRESSTNVTGDDPAVTAKIALAHLNESADSCTGLERMEDEAKREPGDRCALTATHPKGMVRRPAGS
jgi:Protein of unknown function (DUF5661)